LYGGLSGSSQKKIQECRNFSRKKWRKFCVFLEQRLDSMVFRMNICSTFRQARQLILHHKVYVNHRCVNIPSYEVQPGDIIRISPHDSQTFQALSRHALSFMTDHSSKVLPKKPLHLEINYKTLQAVYLYPPQLLVYPCPVQLFEEPLTSQKFTKKNGNISIDEFQKHKFRHSD